MSKFAPRLLRLALVVHLNHLCFPLPKLYLPTLLHSTLKQTTKISEFLQWFPVITANTKKLLPWVKHSVCFPHHLHLSSPTSVPIFFLSVVSFPIPRRASHFSLQPAFPPSLISRSVGLFFMLYSSANNILILPQTLSLWIARLSTLTSKLFNTRIISFYSFLKQNFNIHSEEKVGTNNTDSPGVSWR